MTDTPNLALPYILAAQAQKHVTHNEAIRALDCLVQLSVTSRTLSSPPGSPAEGSRYVVASPASGDWAGKSDQIAAFQDGAWAFYEPQEGWLAWVADEGLLIVYTAGAWSAAPGGGGVTDHGMLTGLADDDHLQYLTDARGDARYTPLNPATVGINATADTTNRLALASPASLFNHEGGGHQLKVNKATASDTATFLFQDNFSGRAEIGLAGDDDFHFKVSPDGATWNEALTIARATGKISFPATGGPREVLSANRTYYVRTDGSDGNSGLSNTSGGAFLTIQKALDVAATIDFNGFTVTVQCADGTYTGQVVVPVCVGQKLTSSLIIQGNTGTPSNVVFRQASGFQPWLLCSGGARCRVVGARINCSGSNGYGIQATTGAIVEYGNVDFGANLFIQVLANNCGIVQCIGSYSISAGAFAHVAADGVGVANLGGASPTVTLSGTPAFSQAFAYASVLGYIRADGVTFSGSATGSRYAAIVNGVINTVGGGASYLPGNASGTTATGGQYA